MRHETFSRKNTNSKIFNLICKGFYGMFYTVCIYDRKGNER